MESFARRFKQLREMRGWTQEDAAEKLGVSRPTIAGYESEEKNRIPREETLHKIADLFGVTTDYLLGRTDDPKRSDLDAVDQLIEYLNLELTDEEILDKLNIKVDDITLTDEEAKHVIAFIRTMRLMKNEQAAASKSVEP